MAEARASRSKGKKLDSIISKLKIHTPSEDSSLPNEEKNENDSAGEADVVFRRSKRKPGKIVRYRIDDDNDDDEEKRNSHPQNNIDEDKNTNTNTEDDPLPKTIFEELRNGEAAFEEGEDTTVLFLNPSEEIQVKAGPSDDYCHGLLDDQEDDYQEEVEEVGRGREKKKKKKKSKSYESDESLDEDGLPRRVTCTACGRHVNPAHGTILRHPILNVLVCKKCNQYYNSGPFTRDEYGIEEQCRWCGDGGDLICCDECEKVYCKPCIQRNCGKTYMKNLLNAPEDFKWLCIVCNKDKPLRHIQRLKKKCELVMEALDRIKAQKAHFKSKKGKQPSIVIGPTTLERRSRLTCLSEGIGIKGEGFSSSGESPTKKSFPKEDLPAELFSQTEIEEENEKGISKEKEEEKDGKKDDAEEVDKDEKESGKENEEVEEGVKEGENENEKENKYDEAVDHLSSEEIDKEKRTADVDDDKHLDETSGDKTSVSQEEVVEQISKRRSSRRLQSSDQSVKSNDSNEEESNSNASTSSKKGKTKTDPSDQETTERRKTRSQKDATAEPEEKEISGDDLADVQEQEKDTLKEKREKKSTIQNPKSNDIEGEEDGSPEQRVTRSRKEKKNKEKTKEKKNKDKIDAELNEKDPTDEEMEKDEKEQIIEEKTKTKKNMEKIEAEPSEKDPTDEEMEKDENEQIVQESPSVEEETNEKQKKGKKTGMAKKMKQEFEIEEQDSSEDFVSEKRLSRKSKDNANKVLQTKSGATEKEMKKCPASKKEIILIESSEEEESYEKVTEQKRFGKEKKKADVKPKENKTDKASLRSSRRNKLKETKMAKQLEVKKEKDSSSEFESEKEMKNINKRKRKESTEDESFAEEASEEESIKKETSDDDFDSEDERTPLKKLKQTKARESSSESSSEKKKKLRKTNFDKKKKQLEESSESESDVKSKKYKTRKPKKGEERVSISKESSESSPEKKKKARKTNFDKKKKQLEESSESESDVTSKEYRKRKPKKEVENDYISDESPESDVEKKKKARKTNFDKKKKQLEESSESEPDVTSKKKKRKKDDDENNYILDESSESDEERTSEESEESESDQEVRPRRRGRGLQKQTRKRPRPIDSSSSQLSDEQSSEESDVGITRRRRKRRQEESESSDIETKNRRKTKVKGKKSEKEKKPKNRRGKRRKIVFESDEEDESEEELSDDKSESFSESEEEDERPKLRKSKRQKKTQKKKKKNTKKAAAKKKGRRRIRKNSDSDEDEDEEPDEKSPRKGRKKIRQLLTDEKLGEETQKARRLEEERRKRLLERTRILEDEEMPKESWHMSSLVLEKDDETKEPLVHVHEDLIQHLKPHQAKGIQFMYNNVVDTVKAYKDEDPGGGCILAHCMGLGKTLQVVALIHTLFNSDQLEFRTALIIAPLNTVLNWQVEFDKWLGVDDRMEVFVLKEAGANNWRRADMLKQWQRYGGIMIMGYDMYRNLALCQRIRSKHQKKIFKQTLVDPGPDLVVCDEGHILRNDQSAISKTVNDIKTKRRIVLTGTPLQNNLIEYHCMMSFVKPNLLGTRREFMNTFGNPILNGQCADSTPIDVRLMKQRCHVLFKLLEGCVQRRDYSVLTPFLPPKHEYVLKIRLSETQRKLYKHYLNTFVCPEGDLSKGRGASLFSDYQALMRIWTHPWCLKLEAIRRSLRTSYEDTDDSLDGFVVHSDEEEEESEPSLSSDKSLSLSEDSDDGKKRKNKKNQPFQLESSSENESEDNTSDEEVMPQPSTRRTTRSQAPMKIETEEMTDVVEVGENGDDVKPGRSGSNTRSGAVFKEDVPVEEEKEWYDEFLTDEDEYNLELSGKMALLLEILADAEAVEEKVLVFSQSLVTLDLIERALGGGEVGGDRENWCRGCDYFRMDGSTSVQLRQRWADIFNDVDNKTARLFLISTKAGGLGINLVAANRVIVFDVSWNPSHDVQSIFRVFRFGQTRPVYVYRLVTQGTMEEKIYERQIAKLSISERVIDKHQIERHFTAADLAELYNFNPEIYDEEKDNDNLPKLPLPKDAVLADIINRMHPKWIVKYHEHDSLLQNIEGEELTEEECQMAWSQYEAQKDQAKNQERVRALQAAYAQQQLQQQRQAIPQNSQYNNVLLREMQQLQQQQLSERMPRYQVDVMRLQQERQRYMAAQNQNPMQQSRTDQLRHQLLQHVGASHPVYPVHAQSGPGSAAPSYQPMMSYLSQQQQQRQQQQHVLGQRGPSSQVVQLPQSQPLSHPRPTAPPMTVLPPGAQYRR